MALNVIKIKKWAALLLIGFATTITFYIGLIQYKGNFWYALMFFGGGLIVSVIVANFLLLKNAFSDLVEGKGILLLNIDSTGIIAPTIINVSSPFMFGKFRGKRIKDVFNRSAVFMMRKPEKNSKPAIVEDQRLKFELDEQQYNKARFALFHFPTLIWNHQLNCFITKDWLSEKEKDGFAEHTLLYVKTKMEELTSVVRDFGRYVVELTKPQGSIFQNKWFWIVLAIGLVLLVIVFANPIIELIGNMAGTIQGATDSTTSSAAITPRG